MTAATSSAAAALEQLAAEINAAHAEASRSGREMVMHSLRAGAALIEAKEQVPHGTWQAWVAENFEGSYRTAALYMQLAREPEKVQGLATLGLEGIAKALATPKPPNPQSAPRRSIR